METRESVDARQHRAEQAKLRPLNTSTLGPIRAEPNALAERARVVREALRSMSNEPGCGDLFCLLGQSASDETLAKLGRLLK